MFSCSLYVWRVCVCMLAINSIWCCEWQQMCNVTWWVCSSDIGWIKGYPSGKGIIRSIIIIYNIIYNNIYYNLFIGLLDQIPSTYELTATVLLQKCKIRKIPKDNTTASCTTDTSSNIHNNDLHTETSRCLWSITNLALCNIYRAITSQYACSGTSSAYILPHYCISLIHYHNFPILCYYKWYQVA